METDTRVSSNRTILKAMDDTHGLMVDNFKASGRTIRCMEKALSSGQMVASTKVSMFMRRKRAMECSVGLMAGIMQETGEMANKMARVFTGTRKELREKASGVTERKLNGLIDIVTS